MDFISESNISLDHSWLLWYYTCSFSPPLGSEMTHHPLELCHSRMTEQVINSCRGLRVSQPFVCSAFWSVSSPTSMCFCAFQHFNIPAWCFVHDICLTSSLFIINLVQLDSNSISNTHRHIALLKNYFLAPFGYYSSTIH